MTAKPRRARAAARLVLDDAKRARLLELARSQCTLAEAARVLGVTVQAIARNPDAQEAYDRARAEGLEALRRAQLKLAETSAPMAMFLGRAYLDQSDRPETEQSGAKDVSSAVERLKSKLAGAAAAAPPQNDREGD
jgi:hypothetical protein